MNGTSNKITTRDGCHLDRAVVVSPDIIKPTMSHDHWRLITDPSGQEKSIRGTEHFAIPEDRLVIGDGRPLGKGGFGQVKMATLLPAKRSSGVRARTVAVKILEADDWDVPPVRVEYVSFRVLNAVLPLIFLPKQRVAREVLVWSACKHEHILEFVGYSFSNDGATAYLVSPFLRNGNIKQYLSKKDVGPLQRLKFVSWILIRVRYTSY
ncbi:hypothetical protein FRC01_002073 [Tulasnella sp. 417]|nr:hypothetical protein FRC01_002073 [Tulasnella sp. 417]